MQHIRYQFRTSDGLLHVYDLDIVRHPSTHEVLDIRWRGSKSIYGLINDQKRQDILAQADPLWDEHLAHLQFEYNRPEKVAEREAQAEALRSTLAGERMTRETVYPDGHRAGD